jgi:hypothetical protein
MPYQDLDASYLTDRLSSHARTSRASHLLTQLRQLGYEVTLQPAG